ncbi:MAG: 8-oxoguanine DNA glycosylase [Eubacterium sp.]|nr:8-oxoguanine DNA glycosylase [Eubacterium sp.]MCM1217288.1 8-oxoguanine DNA glycosylase [Lachnospiraceae bacterium]MCM1240729.1 8-oxoguanine DNA glycosylase [Lachnospiraceae bacterium]
MIRRKTENFSLEQICRSGQCFRMEERSDGRYRVVAGKRCLELEQQGEEVLFYCEEAEFRDFWEDYFDLKGDYADYISRIDPDDAYLKNAAEFGGGIRILKQDLWEMTVSFLISQQNNIARIRRCIENICERYGERMADGSGEAYYAFPLPEALAGLEENALMECNLGYRSKYVVRAAKSAADGGFDLDLVRHLPYREAREELMRLFGAGGKVADCICLFALHQLEAFPVDTHIDRALQAHYSQGFPMERYDGFQGVLQQYIFYYELTGKGTVVRGDRK